MYVYWVLPPDLIRILHTRKFIHCLTKSCYGANNDGCDCIPRLISLSYTSSMFCVCLFQVKTKSYHPPEMPHLGQIQARVTAVGDDGLIYMRTHDAGSSFCISANNEIQMTTKSVVPHGAAVFVRTSA